MTMTKKELAEQKRKFALHVNLIGHQENIPKSEATFRAWCEGEAGLSRRLGQMQLPLKGESK